MKNLYRITNKAGATLCFQVATNESEAIETAKTFYGQKTAKHAEFVRAE